MRIKLRYLYILLSVLSFRLICYGQNKTIDDLKLALKNATHDTMRCNILNAMVEEEYDERVWPIYNEQLKTLAEKHLHSTSSKPERNFYLRHFGNTINNTGYLSKLKGNIPLALDCYHKSLKIQEEINDQIGIATSLNNIAAIYDGQGYSTRALEYNYRSLKIQETIHEKSGMANSLNNIGAIYRRQGNTTKALDYYFKSLKIQQEINDTEGAGYSLINIGVIYDNSNQRDKALVYYHKALINQESINDKAGMANALNSIAVTLMQKGKINEAFKYAKRSFSVAKEVSYPENIKRAALTLKTIYLMQNKYKESLEMLELHIQMRDSINNSETKKASTRRQFQYQYEKKAAADSVKNIEEQKVKNALLHAQHAQLKQEKTQRYALYSGLVLVLVFLVFVINRFKITQKQKTIIEVQKRKVDKAYEQLQEKNKEVLDSIHYARRIQTALLTSSIYFDRELKRLTENSKSTKD